MQALTRVFSTSSAIPFRSAGTRLSLVRTTILVVLIPRVLPISSVTMGRIGPGRSD